MMSPIRSFARQRLTESGEEEDTQRRHAEFLRALAERGSGEAIVTAVYRDASVVRVTLARDAIFSGDLVVPRN